MGLHVRPVVACDAQYLSVSHLTSKLECRNVTKERKSDSRRQRKTPNCYAVVTAVDHVCGGQLATCNAITAARFLPLRFTSCPARLFLLFLTLHSYRIIIVELLDNVDKVRLCGYQYQLDAQIYAMILHGGHQKLNR